MSILLGAGAWSEAGAQRAEYYEARLSATPRDTAMRATLAGRGAAEATLVGRRLTITGKFEGLKSPATRARVHIGAATGVRGPAAQTLDMSVTAASGGTDGTVSAIIELDDDQLARLAAGHLYIQIDSEGARDGNLWGWLLRVER